MPALDINSGAKVLVTGANGFLAMSIVGAFLDQGFAVRGTVRTEDKGTKLKQFFAAYGDKFEYVLVSDITAEGAFDEAVKDVDAVAHTASPITANTDDPEALIRPAVDGTSSVFNSILKFGQKVKRVVMTSSMGALLPLITGPTVVDENSWGDSVVQFVQQQGKAAPPVTKYWASKTLSERAAWDFYEKHKAEIGWELVVLNPSIVIGKPLQEFDTAAEAPSSVQLWYSHIASTADEEGINGTFVYVDIRNVAEAHVLSITKEAAGGQRFVISAGSSVYQQSRDIVFSLRPEYYSSGILPRGNPDVIGAPILTTNTTKAQDLLGLEYIPLEETIKSMLSAYEAKGLIAKKV